ncbi:uncharacterized protein LOC141702628 [Apium graveolens]|uniref:uncharacterized protein LOC141702628 n=1 Tax=Apium graveolens TaxID=4045 RepID=UPI003D7A7FE8
MSGEDGDKFFNLEDLNANYGRKYRRTKQLNRNKENVVVDSAVVDHCALSSSTAPVLTGSMANVHTPSTKTNRSPLFTPAIVSSGSQNKTPTSMLTESTPNIVRLVGKRRKLGDLPRSGHLNETAASTKGKKNYLGFGRELFADEIVSDDEEESNDFNEGPNVVAPLFLSNDSEGSDYEASDCESSDDVDCLSWSLDGDDEVIVDGMNSDCNLMQSRRAPRRVVPEEYASLGGPTAICSKCHARMWKDKRVNKNVTKGCPIFSLCCMKGAVRLPPIPPTPEYLLDLYNDKKRGPTFHRLIRLYNAIFAFTSTGGNIDHSINNGRAPYVYRLNGQNHHIFGSLIPNDNETPKFCQLYIYDTINEVDNRLRWVSVHDRESVDKEVVRGLITMLDETNQLVSEFRQQRDLYESDQIVELQITLKVIRSESGRECHISSTDEVAGIMVGDTEETCGDRDIVVNEKGKGLVCVSYVHPKLMALQYPLLFPRKEDGFHPKIKFQKTADSSYKPRGFLSLKNYYSNTFQIGESDGKKMMEYVPGCIAPNCPDIISRVFRLKLDQLMVDIKDKKYFGVCIGVMYVVEFQKRGLPHNVDNFISAEIPDPLLDPVGYAAVKEFMIHGPCGLQNVKSLCMKDLRCIRHFPKKYCARTTFSQVSMPYECDKNCTFRANEALGKVAVREKNKFSKLEAFFYLNSVDVNAQKYTYDEIPRFYVRNDGERKWTMRKRGFQIGRLCYVHHSTEYGLLDDDKELHEVLTQASTGGLPPQFYALREINELLWSSGKSLKKFDQLPQPPRSYLNNGTNNLIIEETSYDTRKREYETAKLLQDCKVVLPVASSGIAATLMPGGRTAHSRFKIPIVLDECSTCNIAHDSDVAQLIKQTQLIIWDEAPMQHRYAFECLDRLLKDIMKAVDPERYAMLFGGITVVLGGDFRQILPVITYGDRADIVAACITRSRLWSICQVFLLTENMRLKQGESDSESEELKKFAKWVLDIGNGQVSSLRVYNFPVTENQILIPSQFCDVQTENTVDNMIRSTYPNFAHKGNITQYLSERAILTPTNQTVGHLNSLIVDKLPGESVSYFSVDAAEEFGGTYEDLNEAFPIEYLNSLNVAGMPPHDLKLKVGAVVMIMCDLNQTLGLCNGTWMIVTKCLRFCVECEVICDTFVGSKHFIPRMELSPSDTKMSFKLVRKQMLLQICYAMTINKSQGQSLKTVGLYLPKSVFSHGQYYVAISRVTSPTGLTIFVDDEPGAATNITQNIVYKEVFYGLPEA